MLPAPDCPSALPYTCTTTPYNLNFVVGWLGDLLKASRPPTRARWATAPMQQGDVVLTFWSAESPPLHPPKAPEAVYGYRRASPTGWWTLWCGQDGPAEHTLPDVDVSAPTCGHCGRPQPATAELHLCPSPAHPIYSPRAFCPHPQAAPSVATQEVAARCFTSGPHGVEPHSVNVSALPWHARCTPACRTPVLPRLSFLSAGAPTRAPRPPTVCEVPERRWHPWVPGELAERAPAEHVHPGWGHRTCLRRYRRCASRGSNNGHVQQSSDASQLHVLAVGCILRRHRGRLSHHWLRCKRGVHGDGEGGLRMVRQAQGLAYVTTSATHPTLKPPGARPPEAVGAGRSRLSEI